MLQGRLAECLRWGTALQHKSMQSPHMHVLSRVLQLCLAVVFLGLRMDMMFRMRP